MLVKHIICTVAPNNRRAFSEAQETWIQIRNTRGFIGQLGGWALTDGTAAHILSFWKNEIDLKNFMDHLHDTIFNNNRQVETYDSITISHYIVTMKVPEIDLLTRTIELADTIIIHKPTAELSSGTLDISYLEKSIVIEMNSHVAERISVVNSWRIF